MAFNPCTLVRRPPGPWHGSEVDDPAKVNQMCLLAASGMSRSGVAATLGLSGAKRIDEWIARGKATGREPWAGFARRYVAAERMHEGACTQIQNQTLGHIARKPVEQRTMAEVQWVDRHLERRFPADHGAGQGLAQHRQLVPELDLDAWWQRNGLEEEQLGALLREPPESLRVALVREADAIFALMVAGGWKPPLEVKP